MLHGMTGESRVVGFDVEFEFVEQIVLAEKIEASRTIGVVLVCGRLPRFGFDPEFSGEADFFFPIHGHAQQGGQLVEFLHHVRIPERGIPLASAPENISASAQLLGDRNGFFDLGRRVGEHGKAGRSSGPLGETRVGEKAGCSPEQFLARALLLRGEGFHHGIECGIGLRQGGELRRNVPIVETVEVDPCFFEKLEKDAHAGPGIFHRVRSVVPRHERGAAAEGIGQRIAHDMPVGRGKSKVLPHRRSLNEFVGVVMFESKRILRLGTFVGDPGNFWKIGHDASVEA